MKKIRFILLALTLCALCAEAGAQTVTVADVEALPGETVAFTLNLADGRADTYIAMQFDAQFPATGFSTTGDYSISSSWKNATSVIGSVDANGVATIPVSSAETITGSDVDGLLTVYFTVGNNVTIGSYEVTLKNLWFGYGTSSKDYLEDDVTFYVNVVERHTIVLDETSTTAPEAAIGVDVRVKRTIKADVWSTICLPFAMTTAQVEEAFGTLEEDVFLADFTGVSWVDNNICVNFTDEVSAIEANHPFLIKVREPVSEFVVENVDIDPEEEPSVDRDELVTGSGTKKDPYIYYYNSFVGTYVANTTVPNLCLFLNNNKFYYSNGTTQMKGYRGYFDFYEVLPEVENLAKIRLVFDGWSTNINELSTSNVQKGTIYNMNGQLIGMDIDINNLPKGVYMIDGKKVAIY